MVNDPIADLFAQLRNAGQVKKEKITLDYSHHREAVLAVLRDKGLIAGYQVEEFPGYRRLTVTVKYDERGRNIIGGARKISKSSRRIYVACKDIRRHVRGRNMVGLVSTSQGVMAHDQAVAQNLGGELIGVLWS